MARVQDILASRPSPEHMGPASSKPPEISPQSRGPWTQMGDMRESQGATWVHWGAHLHRTPAHFCAQWGLGGSGYPQRSGSPLQSACSTPLQSLAAYTTHVRAGESYTMHTCHIREAMLPVSKEKQAYAPAAWHMIRKHPRGRPLCSAMSLQHLLLTSEQLAKKIW